jgi:hypothetical protein
MVERKTVPLRYIPKSLTRKERKQQQRMLKKSRKLYRQSKKINQSNNNSSKINPSKNKYFTRPPLASFKHKTSKHILKARRLYHLDKITPSKALATATGCSIKALQRVVSKGAGAYFSSGSRPNQTAQSWGIARLASAVTGGKAAAVDFKILENGCKHTKKAYRLAKKAKASYGHGTHRVPQVPL